MTPRFNANRESTASKADARRELPVLFHLMDVSRVKAPAATPPPAAAVEAPPQYKLQRPVPPTELELSPLPAAVDINVPPPEETRAPAPQLQGGIPPADSLTTLAPTHEPAASAALTAPAPDVSLAEIPPAAIIDSAPPADKDAPTPSRSVNSRRKPKIQPAEDWLTANGKYVALGFVVALLATIYFARGGRQSGAPAAATPHAHPGHPGDTVAQGKPATEIKVATSAPATVAKATTSGTREASPAKLEETKPATESQAELFPPTAPLLASQPQPPSAAAKTDENLFPWSKTAEAVTNEERVATRPSAAASQAPAAASPSAATPGPSTSAPAGVSYPTTSAYSPSNAWAAPTADSPVVAPSPAPQQPAYPVTNYRSQFAPPAPPAGWSPSPGAGMPLQYPSPENSARGIRNERTGSGLY